MRKSKTSQLIGKFGGCRALARLMGLAPSTVYRWTLSRESLGTGGAIPAKHQSKILRLARKRGLDITPKDLIPGKRF